MVVLLARRRVDDDVADVAGLFTTGTVAVFFVCLAAAEAAGTAPPYVFLPFLRQSLNPFDFTIVNDLLAILLARQ